MFTLEPIVGIFVQISIYRFYLFLLCLCATALPEDKVSLVLQDVIKQFINHVCIDIFLLPQGLLHLLQPFRHGILREIRRTFCYHPPHTVQQLAWILSIHVQKTQKSFIPSCNVASGIFLLDKQQKTYLTLLLRHQRPSEFLLICCPLFSLWSQTVSRNINNRQTALGLIQILRSIKNRYGGLYFDRFGRYNVFKSVLIFFEDETIILDSELIFFYELSKGTSPRVAVAYKHEHLVGFGYGLPGVDCFGEEGKWLCHVVKKVLNFTDIIAYQSKQAQKEQILCQH